MITKDYSQAGQTRFVDAVIGGRRDGSFVEVGCSHPTELSNTYALESELGWRGLMLDCDLNSVEMCRAQRASRVVCADATQFDFRTALSELPVLIDYLSFDVDEFQIPALINFLAAVDAAFRTFRVLTVETDRYRFGDRPREQIIRMLSDRGYDLIADDVKSQNCPYETFWVHPAHVDTARAERFRSSGLDWADVLRKGGAL